jgi:outer membrane lipoprotein-sorting protein
VSDVECRLFSAADRGVGYYCQAQLWPDQRTTWYFSRKDFLPRARYDEYTLADGGTGVLKRTVSHLTADPTLTKDVFSFKLPDGYTRTDQPAP